MFDFANAQDGTVSPFSRLSIGDIQEPSFSRNFAMGHMAYALQGPNNINPYNPASYSRLVWTSFEVALITRNFWLETEKQSQRSNVASFNHLALAFPVAPWLGMSVGVTPVSQVGYNYKTGHTYLAGDSTEVNYSKVFNGTGGLNRAYLGSGFSVRRRFFAGFNFSYYFGEMTYQETVEFASTDDFNNTADLETVNAGDIYVDFGAQYRMNLGNKWRLDLGAIFVPLQGLQAKRSQFDFTFSKVSGRAVVIDTLNFRENDPFSIALPPKYGFGFLFNRAEFFAAGFEVDYTGWSLSNYNTYGGLKDVISFKTGAEFTDRDEKYIIRLGMRYASLPLELGGSTADDMALTTGLAIPIRSKDKISLTVLNIGIEAGRRGKTTEMWLLEKYINVNIGITLNNKWFIKRVYD